MPNRTLIVSATLASLAIVCAGNACADSVSDPMPSVKNIGDQKFMPFPDTPACMQGAVLSGDPGKGAATLLLKLKSHCTIPWHWHSSNETVMVASGVGKLEMKDDKPAMGKSGTYAVLPARHPHQFTCMSSCVMFLSIDSAFDIHYIDKDGNEIPSAQALKKK
jgi:quercetin dioxygenase-like cupin family protein